MVFLVDPLTRLVNSSVPDCTRFVGVTYLATMTRSLMLTGFRPAPL